MDVVIGHWAHLKGVVYFHYLREVNMYMPNDIWCGA
jgi:hypothetical protein